MFNAHEVKKITKNKNQKKKLKNNDPKRTITRRIRYTNPNLFF